MKQLCFKAWLHHHKLWNNETCDKCEGMTGDPECSNCEAYKKLNEEYRSIATTERIKLRAFEEVKI